MHSGGTLLEGAREEDLVTGLLALRGAKTCDAGITFDAQRAFADADADAATPFVWYRDLLRNTTTSKPILHCFGLHEWAMQYRPDGAPPAPSERFQRHSMALRVPQHVVNAAVEREGISCTHVDALRFFAPAAAPLNHHAPRSSASSSSHSSSRAACTHTWTC